MKRKVLPLFLSSLMLIGGIAPLATLAYQPAAITVTAISQDEALKEKKQFDNHLLRNIAGKVLNIKNDDLKTLTKYLALVQTTDGGLPMYENETYQPTLDELKFSGLYFVHLSKYLLNDVFVLENVAQDVFVVDQQRVFLDHFTANKEWVIGFIEIANKENPDQEDIASMYDFGKTLYEDIKVFINKAIDPFETQGEDVYKKYFNDFKTYVVNNLDPTIEYNEVVANRGEFNFFKHLFSEGGAINITHRAYLNDLADNAYKDYLNRENLLKVDDPNVLGYTQEDVDRISANPSEAILYAKNAYRSILEILTKFNINKYGTPLTADQTMAFINNCGPMLYKFLDLFESYKNIDYINSMILGLEIKEDSNFIYKEVYFGGEDKPDPVNYAKCVSINRIYSVLDKTAQPEKINYAKIVTNYMKTLHDTTPEEVEEKVNLIKGLANLTITSLNNVVNPQDNMRNINGFSLSDDLEIIFAKIMAQIILGVTPTVPSWYLTNDVDTRDTSSTNISKYLLITHRNKYDEQIALDYSQTEKPSISEYAIDIGEHGDSGNYSNLLLATSTDLIYMPYLSKINIYAIDEKENLVTLEKKDDLNTTNPEEMKHYIIDENKIHINVDKKYKSVLIVCLDAFKPVDDLTKDIAIDVEVITSLKNKTYEERVNFAAPIKEKIMEANAKIDQLIEDYGERPRSTAAKELLTSLTNKVDEYIGEKPSNTKNAILVFFGMFTPILLGLLVTFIALFAKSKKKNKKENK